MSDKHLGRIENTGDSGKLQQFSQPWTPQMMTPKLDLSPCGAKMPGEFGNFQLVDNSDASGGGDTQNSRKMLEGSATFKQAIPAPAEYHSGNDREIVHPDQHQKLSTGTNENHHATPHKHSPKQSQDTIGGQTTIPASSTQDGIVPSETLSTTFPASTYREGERFDHVLPIPSQKGKTNYYNGLAEAHFDHGHLKGTPVHVVNNQVKSHLDREVDITLHKK
jgi:hypothetical protein